MSICASLCPSTVIYTASRHRPVSKKIKKIPRDLLLPPLSIIRSPNSDLSGSSPSTPTSSTVLPQLRPLRQLSLNSDLPGSSPYLSRKSALQNFPPKIPTVACLASRSSFFLHRSKFKSQNHKMVVFIKSVFQRRHPASCSRGRHQASCLATLWPVTVCLLLLI